MDDSLSNARSATASDPSASPCVLRPDPARVERGFVFGEERPFAQCHASTLVGTRDRRLVVAFFAGTYEAHPDVAIWTTAAHTSTGTGMEAETGAGSGGSLVFAPPQRALKVRDVAHWNPVLYRLDGARPDEDVLALQFKVGDRIRTWESWLARSFDGGRRFEGAAPLVPGDRGGRGAVRNKPIRLRSGDWLAGASVEGLRRWDAFFDRSPDGVGGWVATARIAVERPAFQGKGLIQPALWESAPGRVHALFRTTAGRVYRSDSDDDGRRWSTARPTSVPNNNSALDVARLADGTLALACNPVPGNWAPRTPLSLLFSRDEGRTWPFRLDVETGPGEFSYPAVVASGEGLTLCYTWNRRRIAYLRIPSLRSLLATSPDATAEAVHPSPTSNPTPNPTGAAPP